VAVTGGVVISADGKTRTVTSSVIDAEGKKIESTSVDDNQ
jgi:hypothetical protein